MQHSQFKIFKGKQESIEDIKDHIETFVSENKVSAKSIGIEFIERSNEFMISLGYNQTDEYADVSINLINFGHVDLDDIPSLEKKMSEAAVAQSNVICHELCISDKNEFMMIFMSTK